MPFSAGRLLLALLLLAAGAPAGAQRVVVTDTLVLYKFGQPAGQEIVRTERFADSVVISVASEYRDRGRTVPLSARWVVEGGALRRILVSGWTSRYSRIDQEVEIRGDTAFLRSGAARSILPRSGRAFPLFGAAPVALQESLLRYWVGAGRPDSIPTLPTGTVRVREAGVDTVAVPGGSVQLRRVQMEGVVWGTQTVWLDPQGRVAALRSRDAEFGTLEAVRPGLEPARSLLAARATRDAVAMMARYRASLGSPAPEYLALVGATLLDGTGAPPLRDAVVVIRDGQILAAGPARTTSVPAGARRLELRGRTVLPGLWDMHAHFGQPEWGPTYLAAGVTTVRDVGNSLSFAVAMRDALRAGRGAGPRLLLAGVLDGAGEHAVHTAEEAERAVAAYHAAGYAQIKIYSSLAPQLVAVAARAAHARGMTVTGHVPRGMDLLEAVRDGMDQVNHAQFVLTAVNQRAAAAARGAPDSAMRVQDPARLRANHPAMREILDTLLARGTVVDPTLALSEILLRPTRVPMETLDRGAARVAPPLRDALRYSGAADADTARARQRFEELLTVVGTLHRAGIPIVAGTDQAIPGHSLHRELELYVRAGMTPMEAVRAATQHPARVMGLAGEVGTVRPGLRADLVVLAGDPLADIRAIRSVVLVVAEGRVYHPDSLWRSVGFAP